MLYQNILIATAFSEKCERTLNHAKALAITHNAKLHLVHFIEPLPVTAFTYAGAPLIDAQRTKNAKEKLAAIAKTLEISTENTYLEEGLPKAGIVKLAKKLNADLIIVGRHGANHLASIMGSTASAVTHHASCDVLIIK